MSKISYEQYNEKLANERIWGGIRGLSLTENISLAISKNTKSIVDIGCGDGYLLYYLSQRFPSELIAFDLSDKRLERVKKFLPSIKTVKGDITKIHFKDNEFETVICSEVLEHISNFKKALSELIRISSKEVIITVPNDQPLKKSVCPKCGEEHYLDGHINKFSADKLKELINNYLNVKIKKIRKFYTIYSYNKTTFKMPFIFRSHLDQFLIRFEKQFTFLKPNFILVHLEKK